MVFCQGCPWRCRYCHNPHLIPREAEGLTSWSEVEAFLQRRRGLLDAVVFSGGEPTLQPGLAQACQTARALGFKVGLHTAGPYPERLAEVLPLVDWVGLDIKARFEMYQAITGVPGSGARARESLDLLLAVGVSYEVRTTVHPALLDGAQALILARDLARLGVRNYAVQVFRPQGCADAGLCADWGAYGKVEVAEEMRELFGEFCVRA